MVVSSVSEKYWKNVQFCSESSGHPNFAGVIPPALMEVDFAIRAIYNWTKKLDFDCSCVWK